MPRSIAALILLILSSQVSMYSAHANPNAHSLDWMEGCWVHSNGKTTEIWDRGFDGLWFGRSVSLTEGKLVAFEDMRIERTKDRFTFFASPNGSSPIQFEAVSSTEESVVFENAQHDFPNRISYVRNSDGLSATISDTSGQSQITFDMTQCAS